MVFGNVLFNDRFFEILFYLQQSYNWYHLSNKFIQKQYVTCYIKVSSHNFLEQLKKWEWLCLSFHKTVKHLTPTLRSSKLPHYLLCKRRLHRLQPLPNISSLSPTVFPEIQADNKSWRLLKPLSDLLRGKCNLFKVTK